MSTECGQGCRIGCVCGIGRALERGSVFSQLVAQMRLEFVFGKMYEI